MDNNYIYAPDIIQKHPEEVIERITFATKFFEPYLQKGYIADVSCGTKEVGAIVGAHFFYDYHLYDEEVQYIDLTKTGNKVVKVNNIYFFHAIEHFHNVQLVLEILKDEFLNDGGRIFIACPNAKYDNNYRPRDKELGHYSLITLDYIEELCFLTDMELIINAESNYYKGFEEILAVIQKGDSDGV